MPYQLLSFKHFYKVYLVLFFWFISLGTFDSSFAQDSSNEMVDLNKLYLSAINSHYDDIEKLYSARSMPNPVRDIHNQINAMPGSKLLFYSFQNDELYIWLADANGPITYSKISITAEQLDLQIESFRRYFQRNTGVRSAENLRNITVNEAYVSPTSDAEFNNIHEEISRTLLPEEILTAVEANDFLIIIPSRSIGSVPFYSLQHLDPDSRIIDHHTILLAPHLFIVQPDLRIGERFIIVGNPEYPANEDYLFTDLPGAEMEAELIASKFDRPILMRGASATKSNLVALMDNAQFIHLATHGIANHESPLDNSFLIFAEDTNSPGGMLTAREIQNSKIPAILVVLSACQTGLGMSLDGGLIGLARAFLKAGTRNVVMSLWDVDDTVTSTLMDQFYTNLSVNGQKYLLNSDSRSRLDLMYWQAVAGALRDAKLTVRENNPEAFYWASFAVFSTPFSAQ